MEIFPTIEALLHYANAHLLFDELDHVYARNRILELLALDDYEEYEINDDEVDAMQTPDDLLEALSAYALSKKLITDESKGMFKKRLMDCVLKRPSEITDMFQSLVPAKGFEWLYDYGVKSGYIKQAAKKWESKVTKGKLEAVFTGCCGKCDKCADGKGADNAYPACRYCRDNEGFRGGLNMRSVPLELYGERMFFYYFKRPIVQSHSLIVSEYHRALALNSTSLNKMFDFIAMMPAWVVAAKEGGHESYTVMSKLTPFNKAPVVNRFKSADYPYISVNTVEWYIGSLRLMCTNREKLIEYADKIIGKWKAAAQGNSVCVSVRKIDSQYCVEMLLLNDTKEVPADYANLSRVTTPTSLMGVFSLNKKAEDQLKHIEKFLTKEERFTPSKLEGEMGVHAAMINRLLMNQGNSKVTELEASLDVKDEIGRTLENALVSLNVPIDILYGNF